MTTMIEVLSLDDVFAHLVAFEARKLQHLVDLQLNHGASVNYMGHGGSSHGHGHGDHGHGGRSRGGAPSCSDSRGNNSRPECQICGKIGHTAIKCWYRMDESFQDENPSVALASTSSYKVDPNWYSDTGATDHITSDLDHLVMRDQYQGKDMVQVGNGVGLKIGHVGSYYINTDTHPLALNNALHVPKISKHLLSVHKLSCDNNVFFEFHPWYFLIKDQVTRNLLREGKCESGLYPLKPSDVDFIKQAFVSYSARPDQWHARFSHLSSQVVQSLLHLHNLPCLQKYSVSSVCNACQLVKSHHLPYNNSIHRSTSPLELIFSDVWGHVPTSIGGFKYYISFIDDFSKFTWIYLMNDQTNAQHILCSFRRMLSASLTPK
jgi:hypothetical protein